MPPARRQLKALGSLQLVGYANNPTKVITELAFIADRRVNDPGSNTVDSEPLEVQFDEFMDGVNSRGKGTHTRQRKMTVEQAAAVLLVTVQKGHVELIAKKDDPHTIDVIKILPGARRTLASFLPKLRGYGDVPYDQQYRGAIALAKRHFFPKGNAPTKKELMALLLQSYQKKRELDARLPPQPQPTKTLGTQTSLIDCSSHVGVAVRESPSSIHTAFDSDTTEVPNQFNPQSSVGQPGEVVLDNESDMLTSEVAPDPDDNEDHDVFSEPEAERMQLSACTPIAPRSFNPYMTPISNPRHTHYTVAGPSLPDASPTPVIGNHNEGALSEDMSTNQGLGELMQITAICKGRLDYCCNAFMEACRKMTFLQEEKEEIEKEFSLTRKKLEETELCLREANADKGRLSNLVDMLRRQINTLSSGFGMLQKIANMNPIDCEKWAGDTDKFDVISM